MATVQLVHLSLDAMTALLLGDLEGATAVTGVRLTDYFISDQSRRLWQFRVDQIRRDPASAVWLARAAVDPQTGNVVGDAGFHGPPNEVGMVEVGYFVDPRFRRQGYGRAMLGELLARARADRDVRVVRASISPDNEASLATVRGFGFIAASEQWDEEEGLELIFEVPA